MKTLSQKRILVTGAGGPAGINACRLLSYFPEVTVYATDIDPLAAGQFFCTEFALSARADKPEYAEKLQNLIQKWSIDALIPTVAEELHIVHQALQGLGVDVLVSKQEVLEICHDKRELYRWMEAHCPDLIGRWQTLDKPVSWESEQYFLKPAFGRGGRGCRLVHASEIPTLAALPDAASWISMENLPGTEWTVDAYVNLDGSLAYAVPRERIQLMGGICVKGKTVHEAEVIRRSEELLSKLSCRGPICIQWKQNAAGVPFFVELNPRLSGAVMITAAAGANPMECFIAELNQSPKRAIDWKEVTVIRYLDEKIYENPSDRGTSR